MPVLGGEREWKRICGLRKADRRGIRCNSVLSSLTAVFVVPLEGMYFHRDTAWGTHSPCFQEATVRIFSPLAVLTLDFTLSSLAAKEPEQAIETMGWRAGRRHAACPRQNHPRGCIKEGEFNPVIPDFSLSPTFKFHRLRRDLHIRNTPVNLRNGLVRKSCSYSNNLPFSQAKGRPAARRAPRMSSWYVQVQRSSSWLNEGKLLWQPTSSQQLSRKECVLGARLELLLVSSSALSHPWTVVQGPTLTAESITIR